jgi:DNA-binding NtrC family response regulator
MRKILVIGRHQHMMNHVLQMLITDGYNAIGAIENEEAKVRFTEFYPEVIVFGGGVDTASVNTLSAYFKSINPQILMITAHPQTLLQDLKMLK